MTLAEKLRNEGFEKGVQQGVQQGMQQGLIEGIALAVTLKFAQDASRIIPLIHQIKDIRTLKAAKSAVISAKNPDELIGMIQNLGDGD